MPFAAWLTPTLFIHPRKNSNHFLDFGNGEEKWFWQCIHVDPIAKVAQQREIFGSRILRRMLETWFEHQTEPVRVNLSWSCRKNTSAIWCSRIGSVFQLNLGQSSKLNTSSTSFSATFAMCVWACRHSNSPWMKFGLGDYTSDCFFHGEISLQTDMIGKICGLSSFLDTWKNEWAWEKWWRIWANESPKRCRKRFVAQHHLYFVDGLSFERKRNSTHPPPSCVSVDKSTCSVLWALWRKIWISMSVFWLPWMKKFVSGLVKTWCGICLFKLQFSRKVGEAQKILSLFLFFFTNSLTDGVHERVRFSLRATMKIVFDLLLNGGRDDAFWCWLLTKPVLSSARLLSPTDHFFFSFPFCFVLFSIGLFLWQKWTAWWCFVRSSMFILVVWDTQQKIEVTWSPS